MSFTPARMIAYAGRTWRTSRGSRARISLEVSPLIPRFNTVHSGCDRVIQCAYWLSGFPSPRGGASRGERKPGVPAVVESPRPTIVTDRSRIGRLLSSGLTCSPRRHRTILNPDHDHSGWGRGNPRATDATDLRGRSRGVDPPKSGAVPVLGALLFLGPHALRRVGGDRRTGHSSDVRTRCPPD